MPFFSSHGKNDIDFAIRRGFRCSFSLPAASMASILRLYINPDATRASGHVGDGFFKVFSGFFADLLAHFPLGSPNKLIWNPLSNSICLQILSFVPSRKYTGFDFFLRVFQISLISFLNQKCSKISLPTKLLSTFNDDIESRKTPSRLLSSIYLVP